MDRVDEDGRSRLVRRIYAVLRAEFAACGYGAIAAIERYLGVHSGYFRWDRKAGLLRVDKLAAILEVMGIEPVAFFDRVFRGAFTASTTALQPPRRPTTKAETLACINETLQATFEAHGRGAIRRTERALNLRQDYIRNNRGAGRLEMSMLDAYLAVLRVDPVEFFRRAFTVVAAAQPAGAPDPVLAFGAAAGMLPRVGTALTLSTAPTVPSPDPLTAADEANLARLDALRSADPSAAQAQGERLCRTARRKGRLHLAIRAAGTAGSARRLALDLDGAQVVLWAAYSLAERCGFQATAADVIQRMSYVTADRGRYEDALALADEALRRYRLLQDEVGIGRGHVGRGIFLRRLGSFHRSTRACSDALRYLPASEERYIAGALQASACTYLDQGNTEEAMECIEEALGRLPEENHYVGRFSWLLARVAMAQEDFETADRHYRKAVHALEEVALSDAALASVELIRLQLKVGNYPEASVLARLMRKSAFALPENDVVSAVVYRLIQLEQVGQLSLEAVNDLLSEEKRGRPQAAPRTAQR